MRQTLDSVVAQSLRAAKWIIVDDGSTDETPGILAEYASGMIGYRSSLALIVVTEPSARVSLTRFTPDINPLKRVNTILSASSIWIFGCRRATLKS